MQVFSRRITMHEPLPLHENARHTVMPRSVRLVPASHFPYDSRICALTAVANFNTLFQYCNYVNDVT
jgi:hypothetical protein